MNMTSPEAKAFRNIARGPVARIQSLAARHPLLVAVAALISYPMWRAWAGIRAAVKRRAYTVVLEISQDEVEDSEGEAVIEGVYAPVAIFRGSLAHRAVDLFTASPVHVIVVRATDPDDAVRWAWDSYQAQRFELAEPTNKRIGENR